MTVYSHRRTKREMLDALRFVPVKSDKPHPNTLRYENESGDTVIRLHNTDILTLHKRGGFTISIDGWNTVTTRDRLNCFLTGRHRVSTCKGVIHLNNTPFRNTITIGPRGAIKSDITSDKIKRQKREIDAYMDLYKKYGLPAAEDSKGDPWVFTQGEKMDEYTMLDWVKSGYRFRLMFVLAMRYAKVPDAGIGIWLSDIDRDGGKISRFLLGRIRRYVRNSLGYA